TPSTCRQPAAMRHLPNKANYTINFK
ncbi:pilin, partial [Neisseria meningitidis]